MTLAIAKHKFVDVIGQEENKKSAYKSKDRLFVAIRTTGACFSYTRVYGT